DSTFVLGATNWADVEVPPHCSALGKVMYAFDVIPLPTGRLERRTEHTLGSRKELTDNLAEVRERGFAIVHEEFEVGLDALAAPVFGIDGDVVAAVGISGPTMRIADHHEKLGQLLSEEAGLLSRTLKRKAAHGWAAGGPAARSVGDRIVSAAAGVRLRPVLGQIHTQRPSRGSFTAGW